MEQQSHCGAFGKWLLHLQGAHRTGHRHGRLRLFVVRQGVEIDDVPGAESLPDDPHRAESRLLRLSVEPSDGCRGHFGPQGSQRVRQIADGQVYLPEPQFLRAFELRFRPQRTSAGRHGGLLSFFGSPHGAEQSRPPAECDRNGLLFLRRPLSGRGRGRLRRIVAFPQGASLRRFSLGGFGMGRLRRGVYAGGGVDRFLENPRPDWCAGL